MEQNSGPKIWETADVGTDRVANGGCDMREGPGFPARNELVASAFA
jgi:hypothetical protein